MPCRPGISSNSLGRASRHDLFSKIDGTLPRNFGIELFYQDLECLAAALPGGVNDANLIASATKIHTLCAARNVSVICLQPFMNYEGLRDRAKHVERVEQFKLWIRIAAVLDTRILAVPSTCLPECELEPDEARRVADLTLLADLAAPHGLSVAYESLAWGTFACTWEDSWRVVRKVDRENFGLCLDTFNIGAGAYADPTAAGMRTADGESEMERSLARLVETVDVRKIVFVQVADAERLAEPLLEGHELYDPAQPARMTWSRNCRLFYGEEDRGACLPVTQILKAIVVDLGFDGWVSAEIFNRSLADERAEVPREHARRAARSWEKICRDLGIEGNARPAEGVSE